MSTNNGSEDTWDVTERSLRVDLRIGFPESCPLTSLPAACEDVSLFSHADGCDLDFVVGCGVRGEEYEVRHRLVRRPLPGVCLCSIFKKFDCVPHFDEFGSEELAVHTFPADRKVANDLVQLLFRITDDLLVSGIHRTENGDVSQTKQIDLQCLSHKQKEAMRKAVDGGFFGPGTEKTLEEIADEMDIASSALSQRMGRGRSNLYEQLFG